MARYGGAICTECGDDVDLDQPYLVYDEDNVKHVECPEAPEQCDDCMVLYKGPPYYTFPPDTCDSDNHREYCTGNLCPDCSGLLIEPDNPADPRRPAVETYIEGIANAPQVYKLPYDPDDDGTKTPERGY